MKFTQVTETKRQAKIQINDSITISVLMWIENHNDYEIALYFKGDMIEEIPAWGFDDVKRNMTLNEVEQFIEKARKVAQDKKIKKDWDFLELMEIDKLPQTDYIETEQDKEWQRQRDLYWKGKPYCVKKPTHKNNSEDIETFIITDGEKDYWIHWYGDNYRLWGLTIRHSSNESDYESYPSTNFRGLRRYRKITKAANPIISLEYEIDDLEIMQHWTIATHGLGKTNHTMTDEFIRDLVEIDQGIMDCKEEIEELKKQEGYNA